MDNKAFKELFMECQPYCVKSLVKMTSSKADAEDAFMEAISKFWLLQQQGNVKHQNNVKAFVLVMAKNIWLQKKRKNKNHQEFAFEQDIMEQRQAQQMDVHDEASFNELLQTEILEAAESEKQQRIQSFNSVFKSLSDKCQQLLKATIVYKKRMKELQDTLGLATTQTVKTAKYRCKKNLMKKLSEAGLS